MNTETKNNDQQFNNLPHNWDHEEIRNYFDSNWNCTLMDLSMMTGYSVGELKQIIMEK